MTRFRGIRWIVGFASLLACGDGLIRHKTWIALASDIQSDEITVADTMSSAITPVWIDARRDSEFAAEHVPGALHLNEDRWEELIGPVLSTWQPGVVVVVYCDDTGCNASRSVAERLRKDYQIERVRVLHGGWKAWKEAGGKIATRAP